MADPRGGRGDRQAGEKNRNHRKESSDRMIMH